MIRRPFIPRPPEIEKLRQEHKYELDLICGHIFRRVFTDYTLFQKLFCIFLKLEERERPIKGQDVAACWRLIERWTRANGEFDLLKEYIHLAEIREQALRDDIAQVFLSRKYEAL